MRKIAVILAAFTLTLLIGCGNANKKMQATLAQQRTRAIRRRPLHRMQSLQLQ
ncbi:hypothetical protein ACFTAO_31555 [Paenibacillus rhizoplanae]